MQVASEQGGVPYSSDSISTSYQLGSPVEKYGTPYGVPLGRRGVQSAGEWGVDDVGTRMRVVATQPPGLVLIRSKWHSGNMRLPLSQPNGSMRRRGEPLELTCPAD